MTGSDIQRVAISGCKETAVLSVDDAAWLDVTVESLSSICGALIDKPPSFVKDSYRQWLKTLSSFFGRVFVPSERNWKPGKLSRSQGLPQQGLNGPSSSDRQVSPTAASGRSSEASQKEDRSTGSKMGSTSWRREASRTGRRCSSGTFFSVKDCRTRLSPMWLVLRALVGSMMQKPLPSPPTAAEIDQLVLSLSDALVRDRAGRLVMPRTTFAGAPPSSNAAATPASTSVTAPPPSSGVEPTSPSSGVGSASVSTPAASPSASPPAASKSSQTTRPRLIAHFMRDADALLGPSGLDTLILSFVPHGSTATVVFVSRKEVSVEQVRVVKTAFKAFHARMRSAASARSASDRSPIDHAVLACRVAIVDDATFERAGVFASILTGDHKPGKKIGMGVWRWAYMYILARGDLDQTLNLAQSLAKKPIDRNAFLRAITLSLIHPGLPTLSLAVTGETRTVEGSSLRAGLYRPSSPANDALRSQLLHACGYPSSDDSKDDVWWKILVQLGAVPPLGIRSIESIAKPARLLEDQRRLSSGRPGEPFGMPFKMMLWEEGDYVATETEPDFEDPNPALDEPSRFSVQPHSGDDVQHDSLSVKPDLPSGQTANVESDEDENEDVDEEEGDDEDEENDTEDLGGNIFSDDLLDVEVSRWSSATVQSPAEPSTAAQARAHALAASRVEAKAYAERGIQLIANAANKASGVARYDIRIEVGFSVVLVDKGDGDVFARFPAGPFAFVENFFSYLSTYPKKKDAIFITEGLAYDALMQTTREYTADHAIRRGITAAIRHVSKAFTYPFLSVLDERRLFLDKTSAAVPWLKQTEVYARVLRSPSTFYNDVRTPAYRTMRSVLRMLEVVGQEGWRKDLPIGRGKAGLVDLQSSIPPETWRPGDSSRTFRVISRDYLECVDSNTTRTSDEPFTDHSLVTTQYAAAAHFLGLFDARTYSSTFLESDRDPPTTAEVDEVVQWFRALKDKQRTTAADMTDRCAKLRRLQASDQNMTTMLRLEGVLALALGQDGVPLELEELQQVLGGRISKRQKCLDHRSKALVWRKL
ncbi:hypothetical protein JCM10296v2_004250 [Rhodotorula toruloides]